LIPRRPPLLLLLSLSPLPTTNAHSSSHTHGQPPFTFTLTHSRFCIRIIRHPFFPLIYLPFQQSSPLLLFTHLSLFNKLNKLHSRSLPALYIPQTNSFELPLITTYPSPTIQTRIIFKMFSKLTAVFAIVAAAGELSFPSFGITRVAGRGSSIAISLFVRFSSLMKSIRSPDGVIEASLCCPCSNRDHGTSQLTTFLPLLSRLRSGHHQHPRFVDPMCPHLVVVSRPRDFASTCDSRVLMKSLLSENRRWTVTNGPFYLSIIPGGQPSAAPLLDFGQVVRSSRPPF